MSDLVIVESPGKVKKISKYLNELGYNVTVLASVGHVRDLPKKKLGVDLESFKPSYEITSDKKKVVTRLRDAAKKASKIYLATDIDREGEGIAWHLMQVIGKHNYTRVTFNEITKQALKSAFENETDLNFNLVKAQETRRVIDRLVGYRVSPQLGEILRATASAGRVQSVALRAVVERCREIENFIPVPHIGVKLHFIDNDAKWSAEWDFSKLVQNKEKIWTDKVIAEKAKNTNSVSVSSKTEQDKEIKPPAPFITSEFTKAAGNKLGLTTKQAMDAAQKLYTSGDITYHRTDYPNLSDKAFKAIQRYCKSNNLECVATKREWKGKEDAQEAHEAIRPSDFSKESHEDSSLNAVYQLIRNRALASQLASGIDTVTSLVLTGNDENQYTFKASGRVIKKQGWRSFMKGDPGSNAQQLPPISESQTLTPESGEVVHKKTKPSPYFTEPALVDFLEKKGIGRPATYASIMETLKRRKYVSIKKRQWHSTKFGEQVFDALIASFSFMDYGYTRDLEQRLDDIAEGKAEYGSTVFGLNKDLEECFSSLADHKVEIEKFDCPECEGYLERISMKKSTFYGHRNDSNSNCRTTLSDKGGKPDYAKYEAAKKNKTDVSCNECGKSMIVRTGKKKNKFLGCSGFPKCTNIQDYAA